MAIRGTHKEWRPFVQNQEVRRLLLIRTVWEKKIEWIYHHIESPHRATLYGYMVTWTSRKRNCKCLNSLHMK